VTGVSRVVVLGLGSVARCTLPLLLETLPLLPSAYTVLDASDDPAVTQAARELRARGVGVEPVHLTRDGYAGVLAGRLGDGDLLLDLAWNIGTLDLLQWCRDSGVLYLNASLEVWDPYAGGWAAPPTERTLYRRHQDLRAMLSGWGDNDGPTAVLDHGANPGLVSHFAKAALLDIAGAWLADQRSAAEPGRRERVEGAAAAGEWAALARALDVQVIHVSERDTQISAVPKRVDEFVNTWSVEGFYEEGVAPAELGWGTHERTLPPGAHRHADGPGNQICLARPGCRTWVRSWVPAGDITGMLVRHGEAFSISDHLTVWEDGAAVYRPTVHYAYCPADAAIASLHELHMRGYRLQPAQRIMGDDIVDGRDELGVLLMGHPLTSWWTGSLLDVHEARRLAPGQNATTLQVAAGLLGAVRWMLDHPRQGVRLPDELPHADVLATAMPYLGLFVSRQVDWTPLRSRAALFGTEGTGQPRPEDAWQFASFLVSDAD
jgi:homospermidine synthase